MEAMATRSLRRRLLEFHLQASHHLQLRPIVKYTSLSFFLDRFMPSLQRGSFTEKMQGGNCKSWLLEHLRESNLQLFVLISIWISSKIHDSQSLSVRSLKALSDKIISDQHFTSRDFSDAEFIFLEVIGYDIGTSKIVFLHLEDLFIQLRGLSKLGEIIEMDTCMEIMDLLYEEDTSSLFLTSFDSLAASILVSAYLISVPKQQWEFPLLPWVKFITLHEEQDIMRFVGCILSHVLKAEEIRHQN
ncbi:cyclin J18 [Rhynchospora pubera]|uniref:Cyclin J18 n=1 Tax=Rhynchospora pubera TaxID=906938 RepID=A0AAV8C7R6_9POAL|nr:cyclin J18 [Rhynchospora pubera]